MNERWWVADEQRDAPSLRDRLRVAAWMQPGDDRHVLSSDRQSAAVLHGGDTPLLVKWRRPLPDRVRRTFLRASRERLEARASLHALARGIPVPAPWAVGELRGRGVLLGAAFIRAYDAEAQSGADAAAEDAALPAALGAALRNWHERGFRHGDCYLKNFLVGGAAGSPRPIGFPGACFVAPGPRLDRRRLKDLAQFAAGCVELGPEVDPFGFLADYAAAEAGLPAPDALQARVRPIFERILERKAERIATRPQREPDGPPAPLPLPPEFGLSVDVRVRPMAELG